MDKLLNELQIEDLPEDLRDIAEEIGIEAMRRLIGRFRGERIYIPFPRALGTLVVRYIQQHYQCGESSVRELARETGMTPTFVRRILRGDQPPSMSE